MQIVIDIPNEYCTDNIANELDCLLTDYFGGTICKTTLLPKGHGKLFDVNDILDRIGLEDNDANREENVGEIVTLEDFDYIPTIIPADTESEGEE